MRFWSTPVRSSAKTWPAGGFLLPALIATFRHRVKRKGLEISATFRYLWRQMARRETLQELIDARGLALGELAKAAGMADSGLRKLLRGGVTVPRVATVAGLAKALGVTPARVRAAIEASRTAAES